MNANISRPEDVDYYMFVLPEKGLVSDVISLSYDDEFGDLDLYLYDQDGATLLVSSTNTVGGQERITMAVFTSPPALSSREAASALSSISRAFCTMRTARSCNF